MKNFYDKFYWPKKKITTDKPHIYYLNKIYYAPMFLWRKCFFSFDCNNYKLINNWYCNDYLSNITKNNLLVFKFFYLPNFLLILFTRIKYNFFRKINIKLNDTDLILLGPFVHNHTHKIIDFLLRLIYLKQIKKKKRIFVPDELKDLIYSSNVDKYLKKKKIIYYNTYQNYNFHNANYLSHVETRNNNMTYKKVIENYKKFTKSGEFKPNLNYKFVLISRKNNKRKLINEEDLFKSLKTFGFIKVNFEEIDLKKQIEISRSAKIMIGYHGAGLSNSFFMDKNNYLIEIVNKYYNHPFYKLYTSMLKLNYKKFLCSKNFKNFDGECDINKINKYIKKII